MHLRICNVTTKKHFITIENVIFIKYYENNFELAKKLGKYACSCFPALSCRWLYLNLQQEMVSE